MQKYVGFVALLALILAGLYGPPVATCFEESVYPFQTVDDPAVPYEPEVLQDALFWQSEWDPESPPPQIVPLGASL